jgi:hypothetical protein
MIADPCGIRIRMAESGYGTYELLDPDQADQNDCGSGSARLSGYGTYELFSGELALLGRLELPGNDENDPGGGIQVQVIQEPHHTLHS